MQHQSFTHHGHAFTIEAEGWPDEDSAAAAMIELQIWALHLAADETAAMHSALRQETEALVYDAPFDHDADPLPAVRAAQRAAIKTGLHGQDIAGDRPTLTIEAGQVSEG